MILSKERDVKKIPKLISVEEKKATQRFSNRMERSVKEKMFSQVDGNQPIHRTCDML